MLVLFNTKVVTFDRSFNFLPGCRESCAGLVCQLVVLSLVKAMLDYEAGIAIGGAAVMQLLTTYWTL